MKINRIMIWVIASLFILTGVGYQLSILKHEHLIEKQNQSDTTQVNSLINKADHYFEKAGRTKSDLDSSLLIITQVYGISKKLDYKKGLGVAYNTFSKIYHIDGDTIKGRKYADSAISVFKGNDLHYDLGFAYYNRSGFYHLDSKFLKLRIEYVKLAANAFMQSGSILKQADILKELGDLQQYDLNVTEAIPNLQKSLTLYASINNSQAAIGVHSLLVNVYSTIGNYPLALQHGLFALKTSEEINDTTSASIATIYNRLGISYQRIKRYPLSIQYFTKGQRVSLMNHDTVSWAIITYSLARSIYFMGHTDESIQTVISIPEKVFSQDLSMKGNIDAFLMIGYLKLKDYERCHAYCNLLLSDYAEARRLKIPLMTVSNALAKYYIAVDRLKDAEFYLRENDVIFKKTRQVASRIISYKMWCELDSVKGDFFAYIQHARKAQLLFDSALNERDNQEITQLQIQYESEKRDKEILRKEERMKLLDAENEIQETRLRQTTLVRNFTIGGVVLLTIIVVLLYSSYRLKGRSNLKVNERNTSLNRLVTEKEWLLKEIHHRVKNNLQIIISLLDSQSMYLHDNAALSAIRDSQSRVHSMSLIHKTLYQSDRVSLVNMQHYIEELVDYLSNAFGVQTLIYFELNIAELQLNASQSIPIGLILNEAITNSIKYAFPERYVDNIIKIKLQTEASQCRIVVSDNGIGLPVGFSKENHKSLGINLMKGLSEDIEASFSIWSEEGTHIEIVFHVQQLTPLLIATEQPMVLTAIS